MFSVIVPRKSYADTIMGSSDSLEVTSVSSESAALMLPSFVQSEFLALNLPQKI